MASSTSGETPPKQYGDLLLSVVALLAMAIGGIVVLVLSDSTWGLVLALVAAGEATVGIALVVRGLLADTEGTATVRDRRRSGLVLAVIAASTLIVAGAIDRTDAESHSALAPNAAGASRTLRDFLSSAVLEHNAYGACEYLTPPEQQRIARLAGQGQTCRDAFTGSPPTLLDVTSGGRLRGLRLRTTIRGDRARITVAGAGAAPLTFTLRPATPSEAEAFGAPRATWRIAAGATALLSPAAHRAG